MDKQKIWSLEQYISCGCNKTPHAADWGSHNLICYGSACSVAIYDPKINGSESKVIDLLHHHKERINSVRWLRNKKGVSLKALLAGATDNSATLWSHKEDKFELEATLEGHSSSVTVVDGFALDSEEGGYIRNNSNVILASSSADSSVKVWRRTSEGNIGCNDSISFGTGFALDIKFAEISSVLLLACALDDSKVHLYYQEDSSKRFSKCYVLTGHEDWVRAIDFRWIDNNSLFLATGSQDSFIRVYRLSAKETEKNPQLSNKDFYVEESIINVNCECRSIGLRLETVLSGHENWVYGVSWYVPLKDRDETSDEFQLMSSSMDKTLVVWAPRDGLWVETARVGEVGGNSLGFYGGKFGPDGRSILGHGYQGSFHLWHLQKEGFWEPEVVVGGHYGNVTDLSWSESGCFLLTCSEDQTTRLHAPWVREGLTTWHEVSRPQVHGHDLSCVSCISDTSFVSGAEEIVVRAFTAPRNFLENFSRICKVKISNDNETSAPEGASVPALGLSNKPVFSSADSQKDPDLYFSPLTLEKPPTEENLMQNTLWPEIQKLYGHGYEIRCVAARSDGRLIASACRASQVKYAAVILWDTQTWNKIQELPWHQLTVLQISFSPDGSYLLTVSRDRKWCLYKQDSNANTYSIAATGVNTLHKRVIWCCAWFPDNKMFATGSRDGVICLWDALNGKLLYNTKEPNNESVTALAISSAQASGDTFLVAGTDAGILHIYVWEVKSLRHIFDWRGHGSTINRISFRPNEKLQFASCSKDHSLKIYEIKAS